MERLVICVTKNLTVFERTGRLNKRIFNSDVRSLDNAEVKFEISDSQVVVRVIPTQPGVDPLFRVIKEQGAFCIYANKIKQLADSSRRVKALYKSLRDKYPKISFTIHEEKDLKEPFRVKYHLNEDVNPKRHVIIYVQDSETLQAEIIEGVNALVDKAMMLDESVFKQFYETDAHGGIVLELDEELFELYEEVENEPTTVK